MRMPASNADRGNLAAPAGHGNPRSFIGRMTGDTMEIPSGTRGKPIRPERRGGHGRGMKERRTSPFRMLPML
jgi:hypothetical protein